VFQELRAFLLGDVAAVEWCHAAERAIEAIFTISENPDQTLAEVIKEYGTAQEERKDRRNIFLFVVCQFVLLLYLLRYVCIWRQLLTS
jgi:hypothetical protein